MTPKDALASLLEQVALSTEGLRSLAVLELRLRAGEETPLHAHDVPELVRVLDGRLQVRSGGEALTLEPGRTFTAPAGVPHVLAALGGDVTFVVASFTPDVESYARFQRAACVPRGEPETDDDAALIVALGTAARITVGAPASDPAPFRRRASPPAAPD